MAERSRPYGLTDYHGNANGGSAVRERCPACRGGIGTPYCQCSDETRAKAVARAEVERLRDALRAIEGMVSYDAYGTAHAMANIAREALDA